MTKTQENQQQSQLSGECATATENVKSAAVKAMIMLAAGAVFGLAFQRARVHELVSVIEQMTFRRFIMMKMAFAALATATVVFYFVERVFPRVSTRKAFHQDMRITWSQVALGATILGVGMTLSGSCPGTVFAQIGAGSKMAWFTLLGGLAGALLFSYVEMYIKRPARGRPKEETNIASWFGADPQTFPLMFAGAVFAFVLLLEILVPWRSDLQGLVNAPTWAIANPPVVSGILIGLLQFPLQVLVSRHLGSSSSYACAITNCVPLTHYTGWTAICRTGARLQLVSMVGVVLGAYAASSWSNSDYLSDGKVGALRHFIGGVCAIFGALLAGGCTSGHVLSGLAHQSKYSFVAMMCMFGSAIATGLILLVKGY